MDGSIEAIEESIKAIATAERNHGVVRVTVKDRNDALKQALQGAIKVALNTKPLERR